MNRRSLIKAAFVIFVARPLTATSQRPEPIRRIGLLSLGDPEESDAERQQFWAPVRRLGWVEGKNLIVEGRYARLQAELLQPLAEELVRLKVDAIVVSGTDAAVAAKNATNTIPIILFSVGDPVRAGLVASLSKPGGNITGFSVVSPEVENKQLELLRDLLPEARRVGVLANSKNPMSFVGRKEYEQAFTALRFEPLFIDVATAGELEHAVAEVVHQRGHALIVPADWLFVTNATSIMRTALSLKLPAVVGNRELLMAGGLALYSVSESSAYVEDQRRRYFILLDKILRGANPGNIPIEQPTKFELVLNLKTARTLGLTVSPTLLVRADEVIQ